MYNNSMEALKENSQKPLLTLTPQQVEEFYTQGFIILKNVFDRDEIKRIEKSFELLWQTAQDMGGLTQEIEGSQFVFEEHGGLNRIVWCGAVEKFLLNISTDKRILDPVADILGSTRVNQIINQAHFKMPGEGVKFDWHQDSEHRRYGTEMWNDVNGRGSYVQTVLAVDEMHEGNGPLIFIPESNREGHLDLLNKPEELEKFKDSKKLALNMQPGDLALFGPYTIHSSSVNKSTGPRRVLINGYAYPGANGRVYPGAGLGREIILEE